MLKNVHPLLTPELLFALASMGHGDEVAIVDANFPAARVARAQGASCVVLSGCNSTLALEAVLSVLPLDDFDPVCAWTMQVVGDVKQVPLPVVEFNTVLQSVASTQANTLERFDFYDRAQRAFLVVQTGDMRRYANVLLRKGVISVDG
jgi:L-fucose mutarotase